MGYLIAWLICVSLFYTFFFGATQNSKREDELYINKNNDFNEETK